MSKELMQFIPRQQYQYYYSRLSKEGKLVYAAMLERFMSHESVFCIETAQKDEVWLSYRALCRDVPEMFFVKSLNVSCIRDVGESSAKPLVMIVRPDYRFDMETCHAILKKMEECARHVLDSVRGRPIVEVIKRIHDYIVCKAHYKDLGAPYSHEAVGVLLYDISVCEGMAKAFKYLADRAGIHSLVVYGTHGDNTNTSVGHAWNIVYVDYLHPYHIDVTFDNTLMDNQSSEIRYDYFLLSDDQMTDYQFEDVPKCWNDFDYYARIGHYVNGKKDFQELVRKELKLGSPLVVRVPLFRDNSDVVAELLMNVAYEALPEQQKRALRVSYNDKRMIFQFELHD